MFTFPLSFYPQASLLTVTAIARSVLSASYGVVYDSAVVTAIAVNVLSASYTVTHDANLVQEMSTNVVVGSSYEIVYDHQPAPTNTVLVLSFRSD